LPYPFGSLTSARGTCFGLPNFPWPRPFAPGKPPVREERPVAQGTGLAVQEGIDRGFHSPANRIRLDELPDDNVLPKRGYRNRAERERGETFAAMRRKHPAVESAIDNLEHRGLDRVRARGPEGFARTVALSVVALNVHRIGLLLREKARRRRRRAA